MSILMLQETSLIDLSLPGEAPQGQARSALIDTGGDLTTVLLNWLLQIDAPEIRMAYLRGLWSEQRPVTLYGSLPSRGLL